MPQLQLWFKYAPSEMQPKARGSKGEAAIDEGRIPRVVQGFVHQPFEEIDV